ncbi:hypothetical protein STEG23_009779, partial [Scotinomys teguina]
MEDGEFEDQLVMQIWISENISIAMYWNLGLMCRDDLELRKVARQKYKRDKREERVVKKKTGSEVISQTQGKQDVEDT